MGKIINKIGERVDVRCGRCGREFCIGDTICRPGTRDRAGRYEEICESCFEKMGIIMNRSDEFFTNIETPGGRKRVKKLGRRKTPRNDLEASVVQECMVWLKQQGYYCERRNTGAFQTASSFIRFGSPGAADLFAVIDGKHYEIECKRRDGKGRLSESQKEFAQRMDAYHIPYAVVQSAADLEKVIGAWRLHWSR